MINKLDIHNFGSYSGFEWNRNVRDNGGNVQEFKRLNIIYGRNYSGKTTLSRIFRSLETGRIPNNYLASSFSVYGGAGEVTQTELVGNGYEVRVYNRDFVTDNLSFLVNQQIGSDIKTFAIIGEHNKEIDEEIARIEDRLGSIEGNEGLRFNLEAKKRERDRTLKNHRSALTSLEDKLRRHANDKIKQNRQYGSAGYNIESIKGDIAAIKKVGFVPLTTENKVNKLALLNQEALPDITRTIIVNLKMSPLMAIAEPLLSKVITPTKAIEDLLKDSALQIWVKQGIEHHRGKRNTCAFCRQDLPHDIWHVLDEHFSKESKELEAVLDDAISSVVHEINIISGITTLTGTQFYADERVLFEVSNNALSQSLAVYKTDLETLKNLLETRKSNLFCPVAFHTPLYDADEIYKHAADINTVIAKNNSKTTTLENDKKIAREALRLTDVFEFYRTISYDNELAKIEKLKSDADKANTDYTNLEKEIREAESEIKTLRARQKDERKGAERVNSLLNHFFGHDGIKLEAREELGKTTVKFEITRNGKSAYNLSEGECSLIAFCYFIAKLDDPDSQGKELIIYIDDPISSLDGNHIFFMFSLIESLIAKPVKNPDGSNRYRYKQLFVSTHNLDFLKYLKRLSIPTKKIPTGEGKTKSVSDNEHFMIERNGASSSILLMPSYLKEYITEFNYLFHQIYKCKDQSAAQHSHEPFFGFGNNIRKFLEAFLFFKYPYHDDKNDALERIKKFFGEDEAAIALVNRLNNEFSHLGEAPDRSFKPVEVPEIATVANYVLDKIYAADPEQYNALLKSIGERERTN
jgi:wobble nucleotide-excising tRNase